MPRIRNIVNERFGRLLVLSSTDERKRGSVVWKCQCDCGKIVKASAGHLRDGNIKSCGCLQAEHKGSVTHGMSNTPEHKTYISARHRCRNPKCKNYKNYGGRGIEFRFNSFEEFYSCLGSRPAGYSLDRIDVNGHYEPFNCRWASKKEQVDNRRIKRIENFTDEEFAKEAEKRGYVKKHVAF